MAVPAPEIMDSSLYFLKELNLIKDTFHNNIYLKNVEVNCLMVGLG
jgi:hypothetical protein